MKKQNMIYITELGEFESICQLLQVICSSTGVSPAKAILDGGGGLLLPVVHNDGGGGGGLW